MVDSRLTAGTPGQINEITQQAQGGPSQWHDLTGPDRLVHGQGIHPSLVKTKFLIGLDDVTPSKRHPEDRLLKRHPVSTSPIVASKLALRNI